MSTTDAGQNRDLDLGRLYDALQRLRDGDFSARLPEEWSDHAGMVARVFNSLAEMTESLSAEFVRMTEEVGKQGMLGGRAVVPDLSGRWREMYDSFNRMAVGVTEEVRQTSETAQAWANGDTSKRLTPEHIAGEFAEMQQRLNAAADRWATCPDPLHPAP